MEFAIELRVALGVRGTKGIPIALALPHVDREIDVLFAAMSEEACPPIAGVRIKELRERAIGAKSMLERRRLLWVNAITIENLDHGDILPTLRRSAPPLQPRDLIESYALRGSGQRIDQEQRG